MYYLLLDRIPAALINAAELALKKFVLFTGELYGIEHLSYNQHQLLHLADSCRKWGPLWSNSAFRFEGMNNNLLKMQHGTQHTARQIADSYVSQRSLQVTENSCMGDSPSPVKTLFRKLSNTGAYLSCNPTSIGNLKMYGRLLKHTLSLPERTAILRLCGRDIAPDENVKTYLRFSNIKFICHSEQYRGGNLRRRKNTMIETKDGNVHAVSKVVVLPQCNCDDQCDCEEMVIVLLHSFVLSIPQRPLMVDRHLNTLGFKFDHIRCMSRTNNVIAVYPDHISKKCIGIEMYNNLFVVALVNSKETD